MAIAKRKQDIKTSTNDTVVTSYPSAEAEERKSPSASSLSAPELPKRKYPGKVAVYYNHPRSIIFEVTDNKGYEHKVLIHGNAVHLRGEEMGKLPLPGAFGRTPNIDGEIWEAVEAKYGRMPAFVNGLIFAVPMGEGKEAKAIIKERKELRNGYEPIDPDQANSAPYKADDDE